MKMVSGHLALTVPCLALVLMATTACGGGGDKKKSIAEAAADGEGETDRAGKNQDGRKKAATEKPPASRRVSDDRPTTDRTAVSAEAATGEKATKQLPAGTVPNPVTSTAPAAGGAQPAATPRPTDPAAARPDPSRPPLADPRLLLTMVDVSKIAPARARFRREQLAGMPRTEDSDSIMYSPEKGDSFGFALQLFRTRNAQETKKRYDGLHASYPNSQEITSVSGKTFFSYWDEVMHIGFVHPAKNMVVVVSCGRSYCDSNQLMELAGTISDRLK